VSAHSADPEPGTRTEAGPRGVLCLGEGLVDLICEQPLDEPAPATALVPHFGGVATNVALLAARAGARVALAGAVGDDSWGHWLRARLQESGVDVSRFVAMPGRLTRIAVVTVGAAGEPRYAVYGGEASASLPPALVGDELEAALAGSRGLFITSNTLVTGGDRELTMRARELALAHGQPVVFDPNVRLHRWGSRADAAASANACVPGAILVRLNLPEAQLLTGEEDAERAAVALLKAGARNVVITLGEEGAILRGKHRRDVAGLPTRLLSAVGAGDAVTATLLARLETSDWYEPALAAGLGEALAAAVEACGRWGAVD
jgi:sugar/nucleoside kinase (ribokinase family)